MLPWGWGHWFLILSSSVQCPRLSWVGKGHGDLLWLMHYGEESDDYVEKMPDYVEISKINNLKVSCSLGFFKCKKFTLMSYGRGKLDTGGASIMPNWPVRDQWEYLRKMERHFMMLVILNSFIEFPNRGKEPVCQKWNGEFRSEYSNGNMWTTSRGDPE